MTRLRVVLANCFASVSLLAISGHSSGQNTGSPPLPPSLSSLASAGPTYFSLGAIPRVSTVGTSRTVFASGCTGPLLFDTQFSTPSRVVLRINPGIAYCASPAATFTFSPAQAGVVQVRMLLPDQTIAATVEIESVSAARSQVNLDGMWFDPETNGSGISFYHAAASDSVFGTWFMFGSAGGTRWYSLQSLKWIFDGKSLVGTVYQVNAPGKATCLAGDDCPRKAGPVAIAGSVALVVIDQNNLQIDAFSPFGQRVFSSRVRRLAL